MTFPSPDDLGPPPQLARPLIADRKKLSELMGEELPKEPFDIQPWGHRIIVVREKPAKLSPGGQVIIPDTALKPLSTGWVLSVGQWVGTGRAGAVGACPFPREYLPGTKVVFGLHAGQNLKLTDMDDEFNSRWVCMLDNDVWFHTGSPPSEPITT